MSDDLLLTGKERLRVFWLKFAAALGPCVVLVVTALVIGASAVGWTIAVVGVLLAVLIATSARTVRGALAAGIAVAIVFFLFQIVLAWFITHPIQKSD